MHTAMFKHLTKIALSAISSAFLFSINPAIAEEATSVYDDLQLVGLEWQLSEERSATLASLTEKVESQLKTAEDEAAATKLQLDETYILSQEYLQSAYLQWQLSSESLTALEKDHNNLSDSYQDTLSIAAYYEHRAHDLEKYQQETIVTIQSLIRQLAETENRLQTSKEEHIAVLSDLTEKVESQLKAAEDKAAATKLQLDETYILSQEYLQSAYLQWQLSSESLTVLEKDHNNLSGSYQDTLSIAAYYEHRAHDLEKYQQETIVTIQSLITQLAEAENRYQSSKEEHSAALSGLAERVESQLKTAEEEAAAIKRQLDETYILSQEFLQLADLQWLLSLEALTTLEKDHNNLSGSFQDTLSMAAYYEHRAHNLEKYQQETIVTIQSLITQLAETENSFESSKEEHASALNALAERVESQLKANEEEVMALNRKLEESYAFSVDLQLIVDELYEGYSDNATAIVENEKTLMGASIAYETLIDNYQLQLNDLQTLLTHEIDQRTLLQSKLEEKIQHHELEKQALHADFAQKNEQLAMAKPQIQHIDDNSNNIGDLMQIHQEMSAIAIAYESMLDGYQLKILDLEQLLSQIAQVDLTKEINLTSHEEQLKVLSDRSDEANNEAMQAQTELIIALQLIESIQSVQEDIKEQIATTALQQSLNEVIELSYAAMIKDFYAQQELLKAEIGMLSLDVQKKDNTVASLTHQHENIFLTAVEEIANLQETNSQLTDAFTASCIEHSLSQAEQISPETNDFVKYQEAFDAQEVILTTLIEQLRTQIEQDKTEIASLSKKLEQSTTEANDVVKYQETFDAQEIILTTLIEQLRTQMEQDKTEIASLSKKLEQSAAEANDVVKYQEAFDAQEIILTTLIEQLRTQMEQDKTEIVSLSKKLEQSTAEANDVVKYQEAFDAQEIILTTLIEQLRTQMEQDKTEIVSLSKKLEQSTTEANDVVKYQEAFDAQEIILTTLIEQLRTQMEQDKTEIVSLSKKLEQSTAEANDVVKYQEAFDAQEIILTTLIEQLRIQMEQDKTEIVSLSKKLEQSTDVSENQNKNLKDIQDINQKVHAENIQLKQRLAQFEIAERTKNAPALKRTISLPSNSHLLPKTN